MGFGLGRSCDASRRRALFARRCEQHAEQIVSKGERGRRVDHGLSAQTSVVPQQE